MAIDRISDVFFDAVAHHLLPEQPVGPKGGRPRVAHRVVVRVLWFVLTTGVSGEDVPPGLGCFGRTTHSRLHEWEEAGIWDRLHVDLLEALKRAGRLDRHGWARIPEDVAFATKLRLAGRISTTRILAMRAKTGRCSGRTTVPSNGLVRM